MQKLLIGWAEIDTTPEGTVDLSGQYYHRLSTGIHSRLTATVLALDSGGDQAVMVALELVGAKADFQEELRGMLRSELSDLDVNKVFVNVIHTHSAPSVDPESERIGWLRELPEAMPAVVYRKFLLGKLKTAIGAAWRGRQPGGIVGALGRARVGHCRRAVYADGTAEMYGDTGRADFLGMEGGEDSGVDMLFFYDGKRRPTGMILNLACPSQVMEATYKVSSDYMGETRRLLKQRYGQHFMMLPQISAAGCQSPRDLARNYRGEPDFWHEDGVAELGRRLLQAVEEVFPPEDAAIDFSPLLRHRVEKLALPRRRASYQDYLAAQKNVEELEKILPEDAAYREFCAEVDRNEKIPGLHGPYDSKLHHFVLIQNNKAVLRRYETQDRKPMENIEAHFLRLGPVAFATNPFELYLDFGHRIKARSKAEQTFLVQLCCGTSGYLPSARAEQLGGYGGLIINGTAGSDGGRKLVDETVQALDELFE